MPTYIYESIPADGSAPRRFEVTQRMSDAPLTADPVTGEPVRRIVTGGLGLTGKPIRRSTQVDKTLAAATPCGCAKSTLAALTAAKRSAGPRAPQPACAHGPRPRRHPHSH